MPVYLKCVNCGSILMWGTTICPKCGSNNIQSISGTNLMGKVMSLLTTLARKSTQVFSPARREQSEQRNRISNDLGSREERWEKCNQCGSILMWGTARCLRCGSQDLELIGGSPHKSVEEIEAESPSKILQDALDEQMAKSQNQGMWEAAKIHLEKKPLSTWDVEDFFKKLQDIPDDMEVVEFLLRVLEKVKATDMALIPSLAAIELTRRRRVEILARLERIRSNLPHIGGFYEDYRNWYVDVTIAVLKNARAGERCNCKAYAKCRTHPYWDDIEIVRRENRQDARYTDIYATCKVCQQRWRIVEDSYYHYPFFEWRKEATTF